MDIYIHTYMHTCIHTYVHAYIYTYIYYIHIRIHIYTLRNSERIAQWLTRAHAHVLNWTKGFFLRKIYLRMHAGKLVLAASVCVYIFVLDCACAVCFLFYVGCLYVCYVRAVVVCMHACGACTYVFFNVCMYNAFMCIHNTRKTKDREEYWTLAPGARETCYLDMDRSKTRARAHLRGNALRCCRIHYPFCSSSSLLEDPHLNAPCTTGKGSGKVHAYYRPGWLYSILDAAILNDAFYVFMYSMPPKPSVSMNHLPEILNFLMSPAREGYFLFFLPLHPTEQSTLALQSSGAECWMLNSCCVSALGA